ncbi:hypothetical protein [Nocardia vaccinii]|nr:hypothetical protein [Nocardia vaccinii]
MTSIHEDRDETALAASMARGRGIDSVHSEIVDTDGYTPWGAY